MKIKKNKVLKIILCFVLISSLFCITTFAVESTGEKTQGFFEMDQVYFKGDSTKVVSAVCTAVSSSRTRIRVTFSETFQSGYEFVMMLGFRLNDEFLNRSDGAVLGSYSILPDQWLTIRPNSSHNQFYRALSTQYADEVEYADYSYSDNDMITVGYKTQPQKETQILYFNFFRVRVLFESSTFNFYIDNLNSFEFLDWSVYSARLIDGSLDNATDKIINGGHDGAVYKEYDKSNTDSYSQIEKEVIDSTAEGREQAISVFNNFGTLFADNHLKKGMLFVSTTMNEFFNIRWFQRLFQFSLSLGIFAFILGLSFLVVKLRNK